MRDGELPVHPAVGARTRAQIGGFEVAGAVFRREVAHDGIRFPQQEFILLQRRHQAVRVHRQICGLVVLAERTANIDALVWEAELANRPHHLLHVDGSVSPPDFDHRYTLGSFVRVPIGSVSTPKPPRRYPACALGEGTMLSLARLRSAKKITTRGRQSSRRASSGSMIGMPPRIG